MVLLAADAIRPPTAIARTVEPVTAMSGSAVLSPLRFFGSQALDGSAGTFVRSSISLRGVSLGSACVVLAVNR